MRANERFDSFTDFDDSAAIPAERGERRHPLVILDDAASQGWRVLRFLHPSAVIEALRPSEVPQALGAMNDALACGHHLAGWFAYELGYALLPKLAGLDRGTEPLLWFGVFDAPERLPAADLKAQTRAYARPLAHEWDAAAYAARFARAKDYIAAGDAYQVNLSFRSRFAFLGDPFALFLSLRETAGARHGAYVDTGARQILSLSPELFFAIDRQGAIATKPMKGTAARGTDAPSDLAAKAALRASEKERAENLMIVDLMRNDLGRIAEIGSVSVRDLFAVETYPTLHAMVSTVSARLKPGASVAAILEALFPCGSVTGAPKIRAMEIIRELEESPRGAYCGAVGCFAPDGSAVFNVAIRTIAIEGGRGTLGLGGGVVHDSRSDAEYAECLLKARFFERARKPIELIETLRWDGDLLRLERHLARMADSAGALSLPFEPDAALAALHSAVEGAREPLRVRLALDEAGRFTCTAAPLGPERRVWAFAISPLRTNSRDRFLQHKTSWRETYDRERERMAALCGADEVLFLNERGELTEGSRSNIFVEHDGRLLTPPLSCGLLGGVLRQSLIDEGRCGEAVLFPDDLARADAVYLGNSLRGLVRAVSSANAAS